MNKIQENYLVNEAWRTRKDLQKLFAMVKSYKIAFGRTNNNDLLIDPGYNVQTLKEIKRQAAELGFKSRLNEYGNSDSGYLIIYTREEQR